MDEPLQAESVRAAVHEVAAALLPELPALGAAIAQAVIEKVPEIHQVGVEDVVLETSQANTTIVLDYLLRGVGLGSVAPSAEVLQLTRTLVQRGLALTAVMRGYRVGVQTMTERWADAVALYGPKDCTAVRITQAGTTYILAWLDLISERLSEEYRSEDERLARERSLARVEDVRLVLSDPYLTVDAASRRLGYRLSGRHVALVLRDCTYRPDAGASLDAAVRELAGMMGDGHGFTVRVDMRTMWCWLPCPWDSRQNLHPPAVPVLVALGRPGTGLEGFRRSHREALDALRVAEIASRPPASITYFDDVDIVAMCSSDAEKCREFIQTELGALTANDRRSRLRRQTLAAFYAANSNYRATAASLGIHHNTVRYRLEQVERALGHDVATRRLPVELALHLALAIGTNGVGVPAEPSAC